MCVSFVNRVGNRGLGLWFSNGRITVVGATAGIGWMIWDAAKFLLSDVVIMGLIVLGLTGIALDLMMRAIGRVLMPWTK